MFVFDYFNLVLDMYKQLALQLVWKAVESTFSNDGNDCIFRYSEFVHEGEEADVNSDLNIQFFVEKAFQRHIIIFISQHIVT